MLVQLERGGEGLGAGQVTAAAIRLFLKKAVVIVFSLCKQIFCRHRGSLAAIDDMICCYVSFFPFIAGVILWIW